MDFIYEDEKYILQLGITFKYSPLENHVIKKKLKQIAKKGI